MIAPGDRIAVGVSGGKDSLLLLAALAKLREFYPVPYEVEAVTLDMGHADGYPGMDFAPIAAFCQELQVPYTLLSSEIHHIIFDLRKEKNPCSMCAKMRRGALHSALKERGLNKIALGHHYDDAVETFFMSLIFEGRLSCFQAGDLAGPHPDHPDPAMLYCGENLIRHTVERLQLPVVHNPCPANGNTKRQEIKELIYELKRPLPRPEGPGLWGHAASPVARVGAGGAPPPPSPGGSGGRFGRLTKEKSGNRMETWPAQCYNGSQRLAFYRLERNRGLCRWRGDEPNE